MASKSQSPSKYSSVVSSSGIEPSVHFAAASSYLINDVNSVDIDEVKKIAHKFHYHETEHVPEYSVMTFTRSAERYSINVYYSAGVVGICFEHPRQGRTIAFRRRQTLAAIAELFQNPHNIPELGYLPDDMLPAHGLNPMDELTAYKTQLASLDAEIEEIYRERQNLLSCIEDRDRRRRSSVRQANTFELKSSSRSHHSFNDNLNRSPGRTSPSTVPTYSPNRVRRPTTTPYETNQQQHTLPPHPPTQAPPQAPPQGPLLFPSRHYFHQQPFQQESPTYHFQPPSFLYHQPTPPTYPGYSYHSNHDISPPGMHYSDAPTHHSSYPTSFMPPPQRAHPPHHPSSASTSTTSSRLEAARNTLAALELAHAKARNHQHHSTTKSY